MNAAELREKTPDQLREDLALFVAEFVHWVVHTEGVVRAQDGTRVALRGGALEVRDYVAGLFVLPLTVERRILHKLTAG